jgi:hypothetical protein
LSHPTSTGLQPTLNPTQSAVGEEFQTNLDRGDAIINALEGYSQDTGYYPGELAVLVPAYLNEIPLTAAGEAFQYTFLNAISSPTRDAYLLTFNMHGIDSGCVYHGGHEDEFLAEGWECSFPPGP